MYFKNVVGIVLSSAQLFVPACFILIGILCNRRLWPEFPNAVPADYTDIAEK